MKTIFNIPYFGNSNPNNAIEEYVKKRNLFRRDPIEERELARIFEESKAAQQAYQQNLKPIDHVASTIPPSSSAVSVSEVNDVANQLLNPTNPELPASQIISNAGNQPINQAQTASNAVPLGVATTIKTLASLSSKFLLALPFLVWLYYKSRKEHLLNPRFQIQAKTEPKIYYIAFGKGQDELGITFEVASNRPVNFLECANPDAYLSNSPPPLFKGKISETVIEILDPENTSLLDGPKIYVIPLTNRETIRVIHSRNPREMQKQFTAIQGDCDELSTITTFSHLLSSDEDEVSETIPLSDGYVRVLQKSV